MTQKSWQETLILRIQFSWLDFFAANRKMFLFLCLTPEVHNQKSISIVMGLRICLLREIYFKNSFSANQKPIALEYFVILKKSRTAEDDRPNCITKSRFVDHHNLQFLRIKSSGQESSFSTTVANKIGAFK